MARKFRAIAKVPPAETDKGTGFVKYRFNNIDKFLVFIQNKYSSVYFINFFHNAEGKPNHEKLCYTWGKKKGLELPR